MTQPHLDPTGDEAVFEAYAAESPAADHLPSGRARTVFLTMVRAHAGAASDRPAQIAHVLLGIGWILLSWTLVTDLLLRLPLLRAGVGNPLGSRLVAVVLAVPTVALAVWGHLEARQVPRVRRVDIPIQRPSGDADGLTIGVLTDTHSTRSRHRPGAGESWPPSTPRTPTSSSTPGTWPAGPSPSGGRSRRHWRTEPDSRRPRNPRTSPAPRSTSPRNDSWRTRMSSPPRQHCFPSWRGRAPPIRDTEQVSEATASTTDLLDQVGRRLRARGERLTRPRQAVLLALIDAGHLTVEQVAERVSGRDRSVHLASVYRSLETFSRLGIVQHVHLGHGTTAYHLVSDHGPHAHAQCRVCRGVWDVPAAVLDPAARHLADSSGFRLDPTHAALSGVCATCSVVPE